MSLKENLEAGKEGRAGWQSPGCCDVPKTGKDWNCGVQELQDREKWAEIHHFEMIYHKRPASFHVSRKVLTPRHEEILELPGLSLLLLCSSPPFPTSLGLSPCSSCSTDFFSAQADLPRATKGLLVGRALPWTKLQGLTWACPQHKACAQFISADTAPHPHHCCSPPLMGELGLHQGFGWKHQLRDKALLPFLGKKWRNGGNPRR